MNDRIKDFIEKNRAEFDHLEAPTFNLQKFKARQVPPVENETESVVKESKGVRNESEGLKLDFEPVKEESKGIRLWPIVRWSAAASVLFATITYLFLQYNPAKLDREGQQAKNFGEKKQQNRTDKADQMIQADKVYIEKQDDIVNTTKMAAKVPGVTRQARKGPLKHNLQSQPQSLLAQLADSSSSSNRLAAILQIKKKGTLSNYEIDRLASSLNHDSNSNVRLAALDILGIYSKDKYVSSLLVSSLGTQSDPMVQLGLVSLLGNMEHLKIEEKLYALAADPNTFGAVKDEAFSILLNQNKL
jgi:hypothetical protein